ncbi:hypothetical protein DPMN_135287 [Dreissena polymorpha]|uniref:Uncharacterized protein n=1 Tax=Dreissena polymorpha TaxID=45954 RepID=A0A9D4G3M3_DREPO|nr:hypothetical protein DPMN_135287 [Dreissena polymorpha]
MTMLNTYPDCTPTYKPTYTPTHRPTYNPRAKPYTSQQSFSRQQKWQRTSFSMARCRSFLQDDVNGPLYHKNLFLSPLFSNGLPRIGHLSFQT